MKEMGLPLGFLNTTPFEVEENDGVIKEIYSNKILLYISSTNKYDRISKSIIEILLLGYCTRFSFTLINWYSQLAKIIINTLPPPPIHHLYPIHSLSNRWTNCPLNEVHVSNIIINNVRLSIRQSMTLWGNDLYSVAIKARPQIDNLLVCLSILDFLWFATYECCHPCLLGPLNNIFDWDK